ncbi:nuclear transport factor 2 (NTF2) family protein with RNA binding (RRM-RBD-RNP motifs) domain-containing protein [Actinidia rufa]|uniref:Nuclear transport factor 2 (NTF2) family protein with RNA binding (RRM-RBD-RNP motifs) domain-containing protein n=1 Tax=Actinidia rufa TaxID=165716 RepID=A0A7J0HAU0_9ERIC|nr:nuclear transport factor 2 (NTF2) family protein with RNA binding (RRM-RBD-RNP motifs) domain-containing protein [Actinidia rufa]
MASGYPGPVSAVQVGSYFVGQYYQVLRTQPDFAHQFYTDASTMLRVDGDSSESASATLQIHTLIMSLNFTGIEVKTINSLESWSGGVLVVVSGSVRAKDFSGRRKFVQTFMLAPQEKGYFVLNDIFHFIDEDVVHQHSVPVYSENIIEPQLPNSTPLPEPPVSDYSLEVDASEYVNSIHIDGDDPVDEYSLEERQQQQQQGPETDTELEETPVEESSDLLQNVVEAVPDPLYSVEEPLAEPPKLTYASILLVAKGQPVPSSVTSVASRPYVTPTPPASEWHHAQPAQQQSNVLESSLEATEENPSLEEEVFVLVSNSYQLHHITFSLSPLRIIPDGVFLRNRKDIGVCYAFVEFEDLQAVQNAIKASPIQLAGRQVYIEERRANSFGASRGGRRGRGRGSYQSEAPRGRFGARSFGRGGNQDGGDFNKSRGNGFRTYN